MTDTAGIKNILVALDSADDSLALLESAMQLANSLQASLEGMFIEDAALLNLASLPFAREIVPGTRGARSLSSVSMERTIKSQREQVQQMFSRISAEAHMQCHFSSVRGEVLDEVLSASTKNDLLLVSRRSRFIRKPVARAGKVAVVCTDETRIEKILPIAIDLALKNNQYGLLVLLPEENAVELQTRIDAFIQNKKIKAEYVLMDKMNAASLHYATGRENTRMMVLDTGSAGLDGNVIRAILADCHFPVVLVR